MYAFPYYQGGFFDGITVVSSSSTEVRYYNYWKLVEWVTENEPRCKDLSPTVIGMMSHVMLNSLEMVPHQAISKYIESALELDCNDQKCTYVCHPYQYVQYDSNGYPVAVVSGCNYVAISCGGGGNEFGFVGGYTGNPTYYYNYGSNTNNGSGNVDAAGVITQNLRNWVVQNCNRSFDDIGRLNQTAGQAFEEATLRALDIEKAENSYFSSARLAATSGLSQTQRYVEPDGVINGDAVEVSIGRGGIRRTRRRTCEGCAFVEVKAYSSTVTLSTANHQIRGLIDAVSLTPRGQRMPEYFAPALFLYTTASGTISSEVANYATGKKVQLYHGRVRIDANGRVRVIGYITENSVSTRAVYPRSVGAASSLSCPEYRDPRSDREILDRN